MKKKEGFFAIRVDEDLKKRFVEKAEQLGFKHAELIRIFMKWFVFANSKGVKEAIKKLKVVINEKRIKS